MVKRLFLIIIPIVLFFLTSTTVLTLSFLNIKYMYEPALIGTTVDYLVDNTYSMAWIFYGVTNMAFLIIYLFVMFIFYKLERKHYV